MFDNPRKSLRWMEDELLDEELEDILYGGEDDEDDRNPHAPVGDQVREVDTQDKLPRPFPSCPREGEVTPDPEVEDRVRRCNHKDRPDELVKRRLEEERRKRRVVAEPRGEQLEHLPDADPERPAPEHLREDREDRPPRTDAAKEEEEEPGKKSAEERLAKERGLPSPRRVPGGERREEVPKGRGNPVRDDHQRRKRL